MIYFDPMQKPTPDVAIHQMWRFNLSLIVFIYGNY
jgi:hypothetical protein